MIPAEPNVLMNEQEIFAQLRPVIADVLAIAPEKVTRFLSEKYDQAFMNPPLQPMLFIDREGGVYGLPTGVKSATSLRLTIEPYLKP